MPSSDADLRGRVLKEITRAFENAGVAKSRLDVQKHSGKIYVDEYTLAVRITVDRDSLEFSAEWFPSELLTSLALDQDDIINAIRAKAKRWRL